jgi:hypothetical protein
MHKRSLKVVTEEDLEEEEEEEGVLVMFTN